ncbi:unnamed protein product, partial [Ectocarpus sp. 12 AP-2014]
MIAISSMRMGQPLIGKADTSLWRPRSERSRPANTSRDAV